MKENYTPNDFPDEDKALLDLMTSPCLSPARIWEAVSTDTWFEDERAHLNRCASCRAYQARVQAALTRSPVALLMLLAAYVKTRAHGRFSLPRPAASCFDTRHTRDDGFITYQFDDPNLYAAVSREPDDRYLLHVEHRGRKPGDLILAVVKSANDGQVVWARWLMLRPGYQNRPVATARLDETALPGDHYELFLDVVTTLPPESADVLRASFEAAQDDDPRGCPGLASVAGATLEAGATEALREVLVKIRDAEPIDPVQKP